MKCASDGDCGAGARCDKALLPPICVQLYCLAEGAPCSDDVQCKTGTKCSDSACTRCDICGVDCVDLKTDPKNCGECGKVVPTGFRCIRGEVSDACTDLSLTDAPAVAWECRTSGSPKDVVGGKKVTSGTYNETARTAWVASGKVCSSSKEQSVIRVTGTTWEFAIRDDSNGTLVTFVAEDTTPTAPSSLNLHSTCARNTAGSAQFYYDPVPGGGFRLLDTRSGPEHVFMPR